VLLDANLPANNALETAEKITHICPGAAVVLMTETGDQASLMQAFKMGARGYVLKNARARDLVEAVHAVAAGKLYVSPSIAALLLTSLTQAAVPDPFKELTEREREILRFISSGLTNREIGERVFLSEKTIKHYVTSILQKLQVRSRVQAALFATRHNYNC
jgi:two-component system, NarL family, nitrate/nitrite response regulator NarL